MDFTVRIDNTSAVDTVTISSLIDDIHGNLNGQGNCSVPQVIAVGGFYECTFEAEVSGEPGLHTDVVTATAQDDEVNTAVSSDDAVVIITNVTPIVEVTKSADPTSLPEPGGMVEFTVRVDNAEAELTYLIWLLDDVYGDLTDVNNPRLMTTTCELATIPADGSMSAFSRRRSSANLASTPTQ